MPKTNVTINRPTGVVWRYFTDCHTWEGWYGGGLDRVEPDWVTGGRLFWKLGGSSMLESVVEEQEVVVLGTYMKTWYRFTPEGTTATIVEVEFVPRGGATFTDGGQANLIETKKTLQRLKQAVEIAKEYA